MKTLTQKTAELNAYAQSIEAMMTPAERAIYDRMPVEVRKVMLFTGFSMNSN
jgi:hypothetical protein